MVEKCSFYILKEYIPEISNEKDYGQYNNMELEDQFPPKFSFHFNFF